MTAEALKAAIEQDDLPDLIISDYHLANGRTGIATIEWLREFPNAGPFPQL